MCDSKIKRYERLKVNRVKYGNTPRSDITSFLYEKGTLEEAIRILKKYRPSNPPDVEYSPALKYLEDFELNFILGS